MRVLINGGAGFIGLAVAEKLKSHSIHVSVADTPQRLKRAHQMLKGIENIPCAPNSLSHDKLGQVDVLIHLTWSSQPANSMQNATEDAQINIVGSLNLFTKAVEANVGKIIFASSGGTVYGNPKQTPITETAPLAPVSAYGISKLTVERYLQLLSLNSSVKGISLRIGNPYGPYQLHGTPIGLIANFLLQISNGEPLRIYGDGEIIRDYIWIEDVAEAILSTIFTDVPSGEYNIGSGRGYSINEIANLVEKSLGLPPNRSYAEQRTFDVQRIVLSIDKFKSVSSWSPVIPLDQGLSRMIKASPIS